MHRQCDHTASFPWKTRLKIPNINRRACQSFSWFLRSTSRRVLGMRRSSRSSSTHPTLRAMAEGKCISSPCQPYRGCVPLGPAENRGVHVPEETLRIRQKMSRHREGADQAPPKVQNHIPSDPKTPMFSPNSQGFFFPYINKPLSFPFLKVKFRTKPISMS